jgi:hypothetical protein
VLVVAVVVVVVVIIVRRTKRASALKGKMKGEDGDEEEMPSYGPSTTSDDSGGKV